MEVLYFRICRVRCKLCGTILEWKNRSKNDPGPGRVMYCQCGALGLDPSACLYRVLVKPPASFDDVEDLSERWNDLE